MSHVLLNSRIFGSWATLLSKVDNSVLGIIISENTRSSTRKKAIYYI